PGDGAERGDESHQGQRSQAPRATRRRGHHCAEDGGRDESAGRNADGATLERTERCAGAHSHLNGHDGLFFSTKTRPLKLRSRLAAGPTSTPTAGSTTTTLSAPCARTATK